jgi:hypothetical protein
LLDDNVTPEKFGYVSFGFEISESVNYTFKLQVDESAQSASLELEKDGEKISIQFSRISSTMMVANINTENPGQWKTEVDVFFAPQSAGTWYNNVTWSEPQTSRTLKRLQLDLWLDKNNTTIELPSYLNAGNWAYYHYNTIATSSGSIEIMYTDTQWGKFLEIIAPEHLQLGYVHVYRTTYWTLLDGSDYHNQGTNTWEFFGSNGPYTDPNLLYLLDNQRRLEFQIPKGDQLGEIVCQDSYVYFHYSESGEQVEVTSQFILCVPD